MFFLVSKDVTHSLVVYVRFVFDCDGIHFLFVNKLFMISFNCHV